MTCLAGCLGRGALKVGFFFVWICICLQLLLYYSSIQYLYRFVFPLSFSRDEFLFSHTSALRWTTPPLSFLLQICFLVGGSSNCVMFDEAYRWSVYQQAEKKNKSVWKQINPLFFLIFSLHIFLLLVIYSNDRDIKQCFVGKSPLEFYGLWHIIKETSS